MLRRADPVTSYAWRPKANPHDPPDYDDDAIMALRSLVAGVANDQQQKLLWAYIMYVTAASDEFQDLSYRPGDTHATAFADGKRNVGINLRKLLRPELDPKPKAPEPKRPSLKDMRDKRKNRSKP